MQRRRQTIPLLPIIVIILALILSREGVKSPRTSQHTPRQTSIPATFTGKCVGVSDGDTIRVLYNKSEVKVRLWGIDCPEKKQAYGAAAKKFTSNMVFGKTVTVEVRDTDRYGRSVGWVSTKDGRVLNAELVRAGMAWWYKTYAPNDTQLEKLEKQARAAHRGLWADKNPTPPWEFRRERRVGS